MTPHLILWGRLGGGFAEEAMSRGSPGAGKPHAGKCRELTLPRQRGGGGWINPPASALPTLEFRPFSPTESLGGFRYDF